MVAYYCRLVISVIRIVGLQTVAGDFNHIVLSCAALLIYAHLAVTHVSSGGCLRHDAWLGMFHAAGGEVLIFLFVDRIRKCSAVAEAILAQFGGGDRAFSGIAPRVLRQVL